jgi:hypothetical protein
MQTIVSGIEVSILADGIMSGCVCNPYSTQINFPTNQHFDQNQSHNRASAAHGRTKTGGLPIF